MAKAYFRSKADSYQSSGSHELYNRAIKPSGASASADIYTFTVCSQKLILVYLFIYFAVCPAGWKPGSDTIKPDVQKSKEFFSKH